MYDMLADQAELKLRIHHNLSPLSLVSVESSCCCRCFKFKDPSSKATADMAAAAVDAAFHVVAVAPVCQGPFALLLPSNRTPFEMYKQYSKMKERTRQVIIKCQCNEINLTQHLFTVFTPLSPSPCPCPAPSAAVTTSSG